MRQWVLATAALLAAVAWGAGTAQAGKVEIKGAHVCCPKCVAAIKGILANVDGVSDADAAPKGSITFTTKDDKTTAAAVKALTDAGFDGAATDDGKDVKIDLPAQKSEKADSVTVTNTHVCCNNCKTALTKLFSDDTVEFPDKGTVKITGKDLDKATVLDMLRKAGWNGTIK